MPNTIQLRRSATASAVPTTTQLALGELAINTYDGRLYLKKNVSGTESIIQVATYDSSGNLGIGGSATYKLDVTGQVRIGASVAQAAPSTTDILSTAHVMLGGQGGNYLTIGQYTSAKNYAQWIQSSYQNPTTAAYNLVLNPLGGNVGVGTDSPAHNFDVLGDSMRLLRSGSYPAVLYLQRSRASLADTQLNDYVGSLFFSGTFSGGQSYTAYISSQAEANSTLSGTQGNLIFYTSNAGAYPTEKLRITGAGEIQANGNNLFNANLKSYTEHKVTNATTTGTVTLDLSTSNVFHNTLTGNTTFAFSNPPANTKVFSFTIITVQDATGGRTITWPTSKKFSGGSTPPPTTAANAVDVWSVMTYDGGTSYIVSLSVKDAK